MLRYSIGMLVVALSVGGFGCDPMHTTIQQLDLQVLDITDDISVDEVEVAIGAKYYDGWRSDLTVKERDNLWMRYHTQGAGTTTSSGEIAIDLEIQTVCEESCDEFWNPRRDNLVLLQW